LSDFILKWHKRLLFSKIRRLFLFIRVLPAPGQVHIVVQLLFGWLRVGPGCAGVPSSRDAEGVPRDPLAALAAPTILNTKLASGSSCIWLYVQMNNRTYFLRLSKSCVQSHYCRKEFDRYFPCKRGSVVGGWPREGAKGSYGCSCPEGRRRRPRGRNPCSTRPSRLCGWGTAKKI